MGGELERMCEMDFVLVLCLLVVGLVCFLELYGLGLVSMFLLKMILGLSTMILSL